MMIRPNKAAKHGLTGINKHIQIALCVVMIELSTNFYKASCSPATRAATFPRRPLFTPASFRFVLLLRLRSKNKLALVIYPQRRLWYDKQLEEKTSFFTLTLHEFQQRIS